MKRIEEWGVHRLELLLRKLEAERVNIVDRIEDLDTGPDAHLMRTSRMVGAYEVLIESALREVAMVLGDSVTQAFDRSRNVGLAADAITDERRAARAKALGS